MESENTSSSSWLDYSLSSVLPKWNVETLLIILILAATVLSRFFMLSDRVMSHDEVNHVVPSWELFQGNGYRHDPVTHGPLQFHLVALSFFVLGDNDFSARVPAALFSIAAVAFVLIGFRRYLGRAGALIAGALFLISPYMLFYGRYTRNEAFIELFGVLTIYGILRYLDRGDRFSLMLLSVVTVLHFTAKETSYIYTAQLLLFVGVLFLEGIVRAPWKNVAIRNRFSVLMVLAFAMLGIALGMAVWNAEASPSAEMTPTAEQATVEASKAINFTPQFAGEVVALIAAIVLAGISIFLLIKNLGWDVIREQRSFDIIILIGTLILPLLAAFPVKMVGWDPLDYSTAGMLRTAIFLILFVGISVLVGLWWKPRFWLINAAVFYGIFVVLYTTFFTNGQGFFTGLIGSLGYWLSQQGVQRGSQPWYFYAAIQVPIYEYLAALGTLVAVYFGIRYQRFSTIAGVSPANQSVFMEQGDADESQPRARSIPVLSLLVFWSITSLIAYSIAGEKMPWLTVHIALPLLLTAGWGLGYLVDSTHWKKIVGRQGLLTMLLIPIFLASLIGVLSGLLGEIPPFAGNTIDQLQTTSQFLMSLIVAAGSAIGGMVLLRGWKPNQVLRLLTVFVFGILGILTARTAYVASFVNYDNATEFLVYAHAARGPKEVLAQVEEISRRTTGGLDIMVAYDNDALYPYWWYFRNYPNHRWYTDKPTRDLQDYPIIIAGDSTSGKMEPIVKDSYFEFNYTRLWWPMQDYFNLTWERVWNAVKDPNMRAALFDIWLNRDYRQYSQLTNNLNLKLEDWQPSSRMKLFIRKDIVSQMWNYGAAPAVADMVIETDPYENGYININPDIVVGGAGSDNAKFQSPRGVAIAPDGSVFVADSNNHRIQHISADGAFLNAWGTFADATQGDAPGGTFNEPWGITVSSDGYVYVADTWNHRIQKFNMNGEFITMWGYFGQAEAPDAFWGPRDVAVDQSGNVFVTDTGNKRIVEFTANGAFMTQFGTVGFNVGQFDEPVGLAVGKDGKIYVADTWNQRIQVFAPGLDGMGYTPLSNWEVYGWFGQSLENKPYLAVNDAGHLFATDPEGYRVLEFGPDGQFVRAWNGTGGLPDAYSMPVGIAVDQQGRVWIVDAGNNYLERFTLP